MVGIYVIKVGDNGIYAGESLQIERRLLEHLQDLRAGKHVNSSLQKAYNEVGEDGLEYNIEYILDSSVGLKQTMKKILLLILEKRTIDKYKNAGIKVFNKEDSLLKVTMGNKQLYNTDNVVIEKNKIIYLVSKANKILKQDLQQIGCILYRKNYILKDLYTKDELIELGVLVKVKGNSYKLDVEEGYIVGGNTYSTYKINNECREFIEKLEYILK